MLRKTLQEYWIRIRQTVPGRSTGAPRPTRLYSLLLPPRYPGDRR